MMSRKEREQLKLLARVKRGDLSTIVLKEASGRVSGVSYRQCRRQYQRYREQGDRGLLHFGTWAGLESRTCRWHKRAGAQAVPGTL